MPQSALSRLPRRTWLTAVVVVIAVIAALAVVVVRGRTGAAGVDLARQSRPGPVVLVPGYGGGREGLLDLAATLQAAGHDATVLTLAGDGTGDLRAQAAVLGKAVQALQAGGAPTIDVVGYSAGGVVARIWATDLGGAAVARRVVMLGTPNHGTKIAGLGALIGGGVCPAACRQLAPDSALLTGLNEAGLPDGPQWISIWTEQDEVVTPPQSAQVDGAVDVPIQAVCPSAQVAHGTLPTDPTTQQLVTDALVAAAYLAPTQCPVG